jgi:hypothetical protein
MRMRPVSSVPERELTSVCAGQQWYGAPRRNRTGDTILTMNPGNSAVPTGVFAGRRTPWRAHVWDQSSNQVQRVDDDKVLDLEDLAVEEPADGPARFARQGSRCPAEGDPVISDDTPNG